MNWKEIKRDEHGTILKDVEADMYRSLPLLYFCKEGQRRLHVVHFPEELGKRIGDSNRAASFGWGADMTHYAKIYYPRKNDRLVLPQEETGRLGEVTHHPVEAETR